MVEKRSHSTTALVWRIAATTISRDDAARRITTNASTVSDQSQAVSLSFRSAKHADGKFRSTQ